MTLTNEENLKECIIIISRAGVTVPSGLSLTTKHKKALEEIQKLLDQNNTRAPNVLKKEILFQGTTGCDKWSKETAWDVDIV